MKSMSVSDWLRLCTLGILWGGAFMFSGIAVKQLPPLTIAALRVTIAALILNIAIPLTGRSYNWSVKTAANFLLMGLLNNAIPFSLIVWSQTRISAGLASILNASTPLFAIILAHFFTRDEKFTSSRVIGVLVGITGVIILIGPEAFGNAGNDPLPQIAVLLASLSYSVAGIFGKRFGRAGVDPLVVSGGQLIGSTLILLPLSLLIDQPWKMAMPGAPALLAVGGLAVFSTSIAYLLYFRTLERAGAGNVLLVTMIIPFVAIFLGAVVLGETLHLRELAALGILVSGLLIIDGRMFKHGK